MQTLTTTIQKLPGGGYVMAYAVDGQTPDAKQAHVASTTLVEMFDHVHRLASDSMKEAPVRPPVPREMPPLAQYQTPPHSASYSPPPFEQMPKVVQNMEGQPPREPDPGLVDRIRKAGGSLRTGTNGWVVFAALTLGYMAQRMA